MTLFYLIPVWAQLLLSGILFLFSFFLGALFSYEIMLKRSRNRLIADGLIFSVYLTILSYITALASEPQKMVRVNFPWIIILLMSIFAFCYGAVGIRKNFAFSKNQISPSSIKQAFDNLNSGICFSDEGERIILINYMLGELVYPLLGSYPQTLDEIRTALNSVEKMSEKENVPSDIYRFPDGRVWQFLFVSLSGNSLDGYTQTIAQDVTELYEANESIEKENELLRVTNEKISEMLEKLSERIRQQETLALKMRVHNDIGSSLIKISRIISGKADEDMETQLKLLKSAVGYFSTERDFSVKTVEEVIGIAKEMNVKVNFDGQLPKSETARGIVALALRECVTNCVRHASGNTVNVKTVYNGKSCLVSFTNNGEKPKGEIIEGGGLSSLRRRVEQADGEMKVIHFPYFELQLFLNEEEGENGV